MSVWQEEANGMQLTYSEVAHMLGVSVRVVRRRVEHDVVSPPFPVALILRGQSAPIPGSRYLRRWIESRDLKKYGAHMRDVGERLVELADSIEQGLEELKNKKTRSA